VRAIAPRALPATSTSARTAGTPQVSSSGMTSALSPSPPSYLVPRHQHQHQHQQQQEEEEEGGQGQA
jgi:hypothetical protein